MTGNSADTAHRFVTTSGTLASVYLWLSGCATWRESGSLLLIGLTARVRRKCSFISSCSLLKVIAGILSLFRDFDNSNIFSCILLGLDDFEVMLMFKSITISIAILMLVLVLTCPCSWGDCDLWFVIFLLVKLLLCCFTLFRFFFLCFFVVEQELIELRWTCTKTVGVRKN